MSAHARRPIAATAVLALTVGALLSCSEPTAPANSGTPDEPSEFWFFGGSPELVECPTSQTQSTSTVIGVLGGLIQLAGATVSIPEGALLGDTRFTVTIPASRFVELRVHAEGHEDQRFDFRLPVVVTMDYSRCTRSNILSAPLTVWYVDDDSKELLEKMVTIDNKLTRDVIFITDHLSTYAIAE